MKHLATVEIAKNMNRGFYLVTGCDDNHVWAGRPFGKYRAVAGFGLNDLLLGKKRQIHQIIPSEVNCKLIQVPEICTN